MNFAALHLPALHWPALSALKLPDLPNSPIAFLWPQYLWLLLLVPIGACVYYLLLRRRRKAALRYGNFGMVKQAMTGTARWRRHVPPALFLVAFTLMILGVARPAAVMRLSSEEATVILAMDVSGSMRAEDVKPSRLKAAQAAAKAYIAQQPRGVRIGVVAFAGTALLVQAPISDRTSLNAAIDRFQLQKSTAIGSGLLVALTALFPQDKLSINAGNRPNPVDLSAMYGSGGTPLGGRFMPGAPPAKHQPVEPGSYKSAVIILLSDGASNTGPDPIDAAHKAADYGIRVFTVGFGTTEGGIVGFAGRRMRAELDEETLKKIADVTHGHYYRASSAEDLKTVYKLLSKNLVVETRQTEITAFFAAAAALFALLSAGLSLLWFNRLL